jgi:pyruvate dehydrogenase E2 component (dihydrolipoamide acetyltransferase)
MISYIVVPQYFENMEEATIGAWLKKEGESVAVGEPLCELITEKTTFELESEAEGILRRILAPEKSVVPVGFTLALLGDETEPLPDIEAENTALKQLEKAASAPAGSEAALNVPSLSVPSLNLPSSAAPAVGAGSRVRATPAARRAARDKGIAIEDVAAAHPGKVISEEDVKQF